MESWYGFDLDGTLAQYDRWRGELHIGEPITGMVKRAKELIAAGKTVKIMTARAQDKEPEITQAIQRWTLKHIGKKLEITNITIHISDPELREENQNFIEFLHHTLEE